MPVYNDDNLEYIPYRKKGNNPEYDDLVDHAYRMQAVLTIQRHWNKTRFDSKKSVNPYNSVRFFVSEPKDEKYLVYAEKIKNGHYHELNFSDPHFIRHIFKALRLSQITLNQMMMAHQIYDAKQWFRDYDYEKPQLRQYTLFHSSSPFNLMEQLSDLQRNDLEKLKQNLTGENQQYYLINLSKNAEKTFLEVFFDDQFNFFREKFFDKKTIDAFKARHNETPSIDARNAAYGSMHFLVSGLMLLTERFPIKMIASPDYDPNNVDTPLLSLALFSIETQNQIQLVLHNEQAALIKLIAGQFDPRLIRAMAEDKNAHPVTSKTLSMLYPFFEKGSHRFRPAEITHPDIIPADKIHGGHVNHFILTWHDFFHAWICGFQNKFLIQHLITLFTQKGICDSKPIMMNKIIWYLTDMVFYGKEDDINSRTADKVFISDFLSWIEMNTENEITSFLLFIDIQKNPGIWNNLVIANGQNTFLELMKSFGCDSSELYSQLSNPILIKIFSDYQNEPNESLILRFLTVDYEYGKLFCDAMMAIGHQAIFCWDQKTNNLSLKKEIIEKIREHYHQNGPRRTYNSIADYIKPILFTIGTEPKYFNIAKKYLAEIIKSDYDFWKVALHLNEDQIIALLDEDKLSAENACAFFQCLGPKQKHFLADKLSLFDHPKLITGAEMSVCHSLHL